MIFECDLCGKDIIESTYFYSLNLNYERFHDGGIEVGTSNCMLTLCDRCIGKLPVAKLLSYVVRMGGESGHERYDQIIEVINSNDNKITSNNSYK
ncbi:hypothetical protein [Solidesulfovibrio magneticus]|uniref:Uncharacterized protein n=1 Tax=Solidesulfovibrio magneticus (strain ATCC 700980 / DSM 13731 / RS-1) TaxID=573370 RepID=C4XL94_SOLM1|nr:hypothetical protein [Solidesulfovibrio magneticus]BAH77122.1 hypothetical protein DMR_36310 [Solidesulfovibrio magneticus RS-1]